MSAAPLTPHGRAAVRQSGAILNCGSALADSPWAHPGQTPRWALDKPRPVGYVHVLFYTFKRDPQFDCNRAARADDAEEGRRDENLHEGGRVRRLAPVRWRDCAGAAADQSRVG